LRKIASSYLFRRIVKALVTIFVMASLTFFLIRLMPGSPVEAYIANLATFRTKMRRRRLPRCSRST
jgi:ABC-type dipeptide/oligopeptide/nickel transport system permease component